MILALGISFYGFVFLRKQSWFSDFNALSLLRKYSREEIDHFASFAFQANNRLGKWKEDIYIKIDIQRSKDSIISTATFDCVTVLNELVEEIKIKVSDENFNVKVFRVDSLKLAVGMTIRKLYFFTIPYPAFKKSEIKIVTVNPQSMRTRSDEEIISTINHEFTHLLGFHHNWELYEKSGWTYKSLFNKPTKSYNDSIGQSKVDHVTFSKLDKAAIRIMYDADVGIDPGLTREKFYQKIEEAKREMEK